MSLIKKEELPSDISKFPPMQWRSLLYVITSYFHWVHWLRMIWKHKSLESYNKFASRRVKEVKIKLFFNSPAEIALVIGWVSM